jgi:hypothetical protein
MFATTLCRQALAPFHVGLLLLLAAGFLMEIFRSDSGSMSNSGSKCLLIFTGVFLLAAGFLMESSSLALAAHVRLWLQTLAPFHRSLPGAVGSWFLDGHLCARQWLQPWLCILLFQKLALFHRSLPFGSRFLDVGQARDRSAAPCFMNQHLKLVGARVVHHLGHSNLPPMLVPFGSRFLDGHRTLDPTLHPTLHPTPTPALISIAACKCSALFQCS